MPASPLGPRPGFGPPGPPLGPVVAGGIALLGLIAAAVRPPWEFGSHGLFALPSGPAADAGPPPPLSTPGVVQTPPDSPGLSWGWLPWAGLAVGAILLGLLVWWLLRRRPRRPPDTDPQPTTLTVTAADATPDLPTLRRGAVAADRRLLAAGNPTDAIVAAWLALEEAATASGVPRPPASTPTEFTTTVLGQTGAPAAPVHALLDLYLKARFAAVPATEQDLEQARGCVRSLAEHWSVYALDAADTDSPAGSAR